MNEKDLNSIDKIKNTKQYNWFINLIKKITVGQWIYIISIILIILTVYVLITPNSSVYKQIINDNKKLENKSDSLLQENKFIMERMYSIEQRQIKFYDEIKINNEQIKINNNELIKLKKLYNEKISTIDYYTNNELDSFFRSRYKEFY